jgi:hypothetical protein
MVSTSDRLLVVHCDDGVAINQEESGDLPCCFRAQEATVAQADAGSLLIGGPRIKVSLANWPDKLG